MSKQNSYRVIKITKNNGSIYNLIQKKCSFLLWNYWRYYSDFDLFPIWTLFPALATKYWNEQSAFIKLELVSRRETRGTKEVRVIKEINS